VVVSEEFQGLRLVQRHQKIYAVAAELMSPGKIHALAIHAYIPSEWQGQAPASPECAHAPKLGIDYGRTFNYQNYPYVSGEFAHSSICRSCSNFIYWIAR
jgi:hypothetical protein